MKKIAFTLLLVLAFVLSACGGSPTSATQVATGSQANTAGQSASLTTTYTNAVSVEFQLLLGTFKLEGTDLAMTAEQAAVMLPLWKQVQSLGQAMVPAQGQTNATPPTQSSSPDTQTQIDTLVQQIQAAMTANQIQAIAAMKITQDSAMTILQEQGITMGGPGSQMGNGQQPPQGTPPAGNVQAPQGTPPPGNPSDQMGFMPPQLIDALVQLLQNRITGTTSQTGSTTSTNSNNSASGNGTSNTASSTSTTISAYTLDGINDNQTGETYTASNANESAVFIDNKGSLTLTDSIITSTGNTSSTDNSSFYGLNAAVLAAAGSTINMSNSQVKTSGTGANGVFSTGSDSSVTLSNVKITASGDGGHAVMATRGGTMVLTNVDMITSGRSSSAIATDRGGGTITVTGGTVQTSGMNSACIYSTGNIAVTGATCNSTGAEAAVIEGGNSISLTNADLASSKAGKWGVMIYQSMSGDAQGTKGAFTMTGGSLAYNSTDGPLFYVTNSTGVIMLKGVNLTAASGILVKASSGSWGNSGSNGGTVLLTADGQVLSGNFVADNISSINLTLQNKSTLEGAINTDKTAKAANLTLDATSTWTVTADSTLASLSDANGISGSTITNIIGNGHTVYYDASLAANNTLAGKTYSLAGGGTLEPIN